nr:FBD-associated F-box protein At5g18780-like [Oryza sativa Japonica Group]
MQGDKANQEDRLSALPDDILIHILDRLKTRDAVRTSVLSRRWRHLPGVLSKIILHVGSFKPKDGSMLAKDDLRIRSNISVIEATQSNSDFTDVLSTCKKLEYLQLISCDFQPSVLQMEHPTLIKMELVMWDHECKTSEDEELYQKEGDKLLKWESSRDFKHQNLNVLRIVGFQVDEKFMTYIRRLNGYYKPTAERSYYYPFYYLHPQR